MTIVELIQLGYELCGTYALVPGAPAKQREKPLTSAVKLRAFIEGAPSAPGRKKALRAVRYILDGSASPMETVLVMLLCLPHSLGGYALPQPLLNHRVDVPRSARKLADRSYCVCDLCWPSINLCVEYDSALHHADTERQQRDAMRRNTLLALGFTVVTVARNQVMDGGLLNRLARQLAQRTGKRLRYVDPGFTQKHCNLRDELFASFTE